MHGPHGVDTFSSRSNNANDKSAKENNESHKDAKEEEVKEKPRSKFQIIVMFLWDQFMNIWKSETDLEKKDEDGVCQCCGNPDPKGQIFKMRYSLLDDAKTLGHLGRGYGMYYAFMKDLNMVLMILTVFVSVIIITLTAIYVQNDGKSFEKADSIVELLTLKALLQDVKES